MIDRSSRGRKGAVLAGLVATAVLASPAPALRGDLDLLSHVSSLAGGVDIGTGGDGSLVLFTSFFSIIPPEGEITAEDIAEKPFLRNNADLFTWEPGEDRVEQFTATANIENAAGDGIQSLTFNDQPSVDSRTEALFRDGEDLPERVRTTAVAFRSNADQAIPGPTAAPDEVDARVAALGSTGSTIYVWDSQRAVFNSVFEFILTPVTVTLEEPSLAMRSRVVSSRISGHSDEVPTSVDIRDVLVAFAGNANPANDNIDGNMEIFLWRRRQFLEEGQPGGGGLRNGGLTQITHTTDGACRSPAVSARGEVAFVSTADITGENPDGSDEVFVWKSGRTKQITSILSGAIGTPRWAAGGRTLVFDAAADLVRKNPDESAEIFLYDGRRVRQLTEGTTGGSFAPTTDARGRAIAFTTNADIDGVSYPSTATEIVVIDRTGRTVRQITFTDDGFPNERPHLDGAGQTLHLTWISSANLDGRNSNNLRRVYRTTVAARAPAEDGR